MRIKFIFGLVTKYNALFENNDLLSIGIFSENSANNKSNITFIPRKKDFPQQKVRSALMFEIHID